MVKITISSENSTNDYTGRLLIGFLLDPEGNEANAATMLVGYGNTSDAIQDAALMLGNLIREQISDPIEQLMLAAQAGKNVLAGLLGDKIQKVNGSNHDGEHES